MRKLRVLALMHEGMVPPEDTRGVDVAEADWKMEFDVVTTLQYIGHEVRALGVASDLGAMRQAIYQFRPHIVFNLLEHFDDVAVYDLNVVAYLELLHMPYTGCNPRGLLLARDKALSKQILGYHRIRVPEFAVFQRGRTIRRPRRLSYPLIVKSLTQDGSIGISQASVVEEDRKFRDRVAFVHDNLGTDAIAERYIDGREFYVGVLGNLRLQVFPVWEIHLSKLPEGSRPIATDRVKWNRKYQMKYRILSDEARDLPEAVRQAIQHLSKRVYRTLGLSGYARIDLRLAPDGNVYVLEANPNPQLAYGEDFAESAERAGISYEQLLQRIIRLGRRWRRVART
ncbi:MAG: ATP-grasp domain-containing protein [Acidobacteriota bacterium]